jgi:hypothetical protein
LEPQELEISRKNAMALLKGKHKRDLSAIAFPESQLPDLGVY